MSTLAMHGSRVERATLILAFMALFPGFFIYNFLLGTGKIRAFLGGYFSPVSLVFVLPIVFLYVRQIMRDRTLLSRTDLYFLLFLAFFAAVVVLNAANGANMVIVAAHMQAILFMGNTFILFKMIDFAQPEFRYPAMLCLLAMSAIIMASSVDGMFRMDALAMAKDPDSLSTYQGFARSYLVTFITVIAHTRARPLRALLYAAGAASLFLNTARSEFVALLFVIPIIEFYFCKNKLMFILVLASLAALISMNFELLLAQLPNNRILELLDLSHSNSAILRHHMLNQAIQTLSAHPLLGDYASYTPGHYAHNILSAWVDLGIFGFVFLLAIVILPAISMLITGLFSRQICGEFVLGFALACVTILLLVKSHYFSDMLIGATLGAFWRYKHGKNSGKVRPPEARPSAPPYPRHRQAAPQPRRAWPKTLMEADHPGEGREHGEH